MGKALITEQYLTNIGNAIRARNGSSIAYKVSDMAQAVANLPNQYSAGDEGKVVSSGALVGQSTRNVTENGTYDTTLNNEVVVSVSGGGGSVVLSGTTTPTSAEGNDEDLYVQYEAVSVPPYDHVYKIDSIYRKVSGAWVAYISPIPPTIGCHIWTHSKGMNDASIWVQNGFWDEDDNQFVSTEEAFSVLYTTVQASTDFYDCNGIATLDYHSNWRVVATDDITDGTNNYARGAVVRNWGFTSTVDFYIWKSS